MPIKQLDLTGCVFSRLTVVRKSHVDCWGKVQWLCYCTCGKEVSVVGSKLKSGHTKSCGCYTRDRMTKHSCYGSCEYRIRLTMIQRCHNPSCPAYSRYGGRGIVVCDSWRKSFENFYADMGPRPSKDHSIDRIDNDGPYCKENCRWATSREQSLNKSSTTAVIHNGMQMSVTEWAELLGIERNTLNARLSRGWSVEEALNRPVQKRGQK